MKKQKKVELLDLTQQDSFYPDDFIDLTLGIVELLKERIGTEFVYICYEDWEHKFVYKKANVKDIKVGQMSCDRYYSMQFKNDYITSKADIIFKDEKMAKDYCDRNNIEYIKNKIKKIQDDIDKTNPVKVMQETEEKRKKLIEQFEIENQKLVEILKNQQSDGDGNGKQS